MADGLVAGQAQAAADVACGANQSFLGGDGQAGSRQMCNCFESIEPGGEVRIGRRAR